MGSHLVLRELFPGFEGGARKGPGIGRSHDHRTPRMSGCTKLTYLDTINKKSKMVGRSEFLSVLGRVRFSLNNGNFPSLDFKPLQVTCFESILKRPRCFWGPTNWIWHVDAISWLYRSRVNRLLKQQTFSLTTATGRPIRNWG